MAWGYLTANGVGDLVRTEKIMNAEKCRQTLIHHTIPFSQRLIGKGFIFQQENDPKFTVVIVKSYFKQK